MKIGVIGLGRMGSAIAGQLSKKGHEVKGYDVAEKSVKGVDVVDEAGKLAGCDCVFLCVKPKQVKKACSSLGEGSAVLVSIAAGITLESLEKSVKGSWKLARAMPNICLLAGESATAYCASDAEAARVCNDLFSLLGKAFAVEESELDAVTALSGSGPAYFYYVLEGLCDAGVKKGLNKELAFELALQTMSGSARLLEESSLTPQELRARVTSPGGTTEAAVNVFGDRELKSILRDAFDAAVKRAGELNS